MVNTQDLKCPNCGLVNPETALRCDCGYDFAAQAGTTTADSGPQLVGKGFADRAFAYLIDLVLVVAVAYALKTVIIAIYRLPTPTFKTWSYLQEVDERFGVVWIAGVLAYFILAEALFGATVGKRLLRMAMMKVDQQPCGFVSATVRAVLRPIDGIFFGLIAYLRMGRSPLRQRLGDSVARTVVVASASPSYPRRPLSRLSPACLLALLAMAVVMMWPAT